jgi:DNA-binding transcriptional LysR family regulator
MLAQIRSFLTVLEEGSLHRGAARLRISQPALSRQMQALEHELGGRLLERMATGVRPTAGGQALAERMGAVLASYDLAMSDTRRALRGETDQLRIASGRSFNDGNSQSQRNHKASCQSQALA